MEIDHEIFSMVISPLPLIQEGQFVSYWRKYGHLVLLNRLGGLSLPRNSVVKLTGRPDMTTAVYLGRKATTQQQHRLLSSFQCIAFIPFVNESLLDPEDTTETDSR